MGGGSFDRDVYTSSTTTRRSTGTADFAYTATAAATQKVHEALDPRRIKHKVLGVLESRDSEEHPDSNAILVVFDVTGSNYHNAIAAQKALPDLVEAIRKQIPDPQIAFGANDDYFAQLGRGVKEGAFQISEFESDNRMDDHLRNMWIVNNGGANEGESYDLAFYFAARKTAIDCFEKRARKGYMFLYADEPIFPQVEVEAVKQTFGDNIDAPIPIAEIIAEAQEKWDIFMIWPADGRANARPQYVKLFGEDNVLTLQRPTQIVSLIEQTIAKTESTRSVKALSAGDATALTKGAARLT